MMQKKLSAILWNAAKNLSASELPSRIFIGSGKVRWVQHGQYSLPGALSDCCLFKQMHFFSGSIREIGSWSEPLGAEKGKAPGD